MVIYRDAKSRRRRTRPWKGARTAAEEGQGEKKGDDKGDAKKKPPHAPLGKGGARTAAGSEDDEKRPPVGESHPATRLSPLSTREEGERDARALRLRLCV